ncbi:DUF3325 family protein [Xylophilus rhododendri]|uniref:DUF3325 family protein n=1 Tax=Xylophilus rhododendri TaxID=2697032 RepID=A0A857JAW9_9BURK|nr:DUF3325 domain-containing protein [Xylophilus rhododendri]QHJ00200.1 DUF3325 family protein [Xylophilus rhododendri]
MNPLFGSAAALAASLGGFCALSLAMDRHYEDSFGRGREPGRWRAWLRGGGSLALLLSLLACWALRGLGQGLVLWCGLLTVSAVVTVLVLSYAPRVLLRAMGVALVLGGGAFLVALG